MQINHRRLESLKMCSVPELSAEGLFGRGEGVPGLRDRAALSVSSPTRDIGGAKRWWLVARRQAECSERWRGRGSGGR